MSASHRINHQPIFILNAKPWRENSLYLEVFSRDFGRVALLARSARTRGSALSGLLVSFVPIEASWFGKEELKTLHRAEWLGGWAQPQGRALFHALYVNELILKCLAREDPYPELFDVLLETMKKISQFPQNIDTLRFFEYQLLKQLGFLPDFERDEHQQILDKNQLYDVSPECPVRAIDVNNINEWVVEDASKSSQSSKFSQSQVVKGEILWELAQGQGFSSVANLQAATQLMRHLIAFYVPNLETRNVLNQLNDLKKILNG